MSKNQVSNYRYLTCTTECYLKRYGNPYQTNRVKIVWKTDCSK